MSVTDESFDQRVEIGAELALTPYERRVERVLAVHECHPWPGIRDEQQFTVRCRECGLVAQSNTPIAPLRIERCHVAPFIIAALAAD